VKESTMVNKRSSKRPAGITVMVSAEERQEFRMAADQAGLPLSMFIRMIALAAVRSGQTIKAAKAA
jgi:hypothetical protein